jgi:hypothetical protein
MGEPKYHASAPMAAAAITSATSRSRQVARTDRMMAATNPSGRISASSASTGPVVTLPDSARAAPRTSSVIIMLFSIPEIAMPVNAVHVANANVKHHAEARET